MNWKRSLNDQLQNLQSPSSCHSDITMMSPWHDAVASVGAAHHPASGKVASIVDYGLLHGQVVEDFLGDKPVGRRFSIKGMQSDLLKRDAEAQQEASSQGKCTDTHTPTQNQNYEEESGPGCLLPGAPYREKELSKMSV